MKFQAILLRTCLLGLGLSLGIALSEFFVRLNYPFAKPYHVAMHWNAMKSAQASPGHALHHHGNLVTVNANEDPTLPRVLIIGDSFVRGIALTKPDEQRFPQLLRQRFRSRLNIDDQSHPSYSPIIYRNIVRESLSLESYPLIMIFVDQTDPIDDLLYEQDLGDTWEFDEQKMAQRKKELSQSIPEWPDTILRRSALFNYFFPPRYDKFLEIGNSHREYIKTTTTRRKLIWEGNVSNPNSSSVPVAEKLIEHLREIYTLTKEHNSHLALVVNPWEFQVSKSSGGLLRGIDDQKELPAQNRLDQLLRSEFSGLESVSVLRLNERFTKYQQPELLFSRLTPIEIHWSSEGHSVVADFVTEFLSEHFHLQD